MGRQRGSAVHPVHLRLHRQTQGRGAHHRRLPAAERPDPQVRVRLSGRRHLLVHRRRGLGHRPQLHRLRAAGQRRHHPDVRGRAHLPGRLPSLAGGGQAQGQHLLHRAHRHPCPDGPGRRAGDQNRPLQPETAGHRGRADQPGSLAVVSQGGGRGTLPDRRHLVADRDRRHHDRAAARRGGPEARLRHPAHVRRTARPDGPGRQGTGRRHLRQSGDQGQLAEPDPHRVRRPPAHDRHLLQRLPRLLLHRRRGAPR